MEVVHPLICLHGDLAKAYLWLPLLMDKPPFFPRPCFTDFFAVMLGPFSSQLTVSESKGKVGLVHCWLPISPSEVLLYLLDTKDTASFEAFLPSRLSCLAYTCLWRIHRFWSGTAKRHRYLNGLMTWETANPCQLQYFRLQHAPWLSVMRLYIVHRIM